MAKKERHKKERKKKEKEDSLSTTITVTTSKGKIITFEIVSEEEIKKRRNSAYQYLI